MKKIMLICLALILAAAPAALSAAALAEEETITQPLPTPEPQPYWVYARSLNVRTGPDDFFPVIAKLKKFTRVDVVGEEGLWWIIMLDDGTLGYVSKAYLKPIR